MRTVIESRPAGPAFGFNSTAKGLKAALTSKLKAIVRRLEETDRDPSPEGDDPMMHPAIRAMSARELADLPWPTAGQK